MKKKQWLLLSWAQEIVSKYKWFNDWIEKSNEEEYLIRLSPPR